MYLIAQKDVGIQNFFREHYAIHYDDVIYSGIEPPVGLDTLKAYLCPYLMVKADDALLNLIGNKEGELDPNITATIINLDKVYSYGLGSTNVEIYLNINGQVYTAPIITNYTTLSKKKRKLIVSFYDYILTYGEVHFDVAVEEQGSGALLGL